MEVQLLKQLLAGHRDHRIAIFPSLLESWAFSPVLLLLLKGLCCHADWSWHGDRDQRCLPGAFSWSFVASQTTSLFPALAQVSLHRSLLVSVGLLPRRIWKSAFSYVWGRWWPSARGQRGNMRSGARATLGVPAPSNPSQKLCPIWGLTVLRQKGLQQFHCWGRGLDKPHLCPPACVCPCHHAYDAAAELDKGHMQVAMITHLNLYSSSCVRSAGTAAPISPQFLSPPPIPSSHLQGWTPFPLPRGCCSLHPFFSWQALHAGWQERVDSPE